MEKAEDLNSKYQRLGLEYQKVRAQVTVLKKAVLDEQAASKVIQEALKQKDQTIRKHEQDIDSLQFRNSQLSKRVEILQSELDEYERKGAKPGKQSNSQTSISFIHEQELQMKIAENESLHKQLQEANQQNELVVRHLEARLEILEHDKDGYEKAIDDSTSKNNAVIDRMKEEQHLLEAKLHKQEEDLKFANIMAEKYSQQLKEAHKELRSKLDKTNKLIQEKMPFIDTEKQELNKLNIPVCDRAHQHKAQLFLDVFTNHLIVFMAGLSDYHTYLEQRLKAYSVDVKQEELSSVNAKFCTHLLTNASHSRKVQHCLKLLQEQSQDEVFISMETLSNFKDVSSAFQAYVKYLEKLLPYQIISIDEECRSSTWSESLEKCNNKLLCEEKKLTSLFKKLASYVSLLASTELPTSSMSTCVNNLNTTFSAMNSCFKAICNHYVNKSEEEHGLPTYTERLKITDECLLSTLNSLETSSGKLCSLFKENLSFMVASRGFKRKGLPSDVSQNLPINLKSFFNKASSYIQDVQQPPAQSVPYALAVRNYRSLVTSSSDADTRSQQQVVDSQECIMKLEQEKEHWMLETQLLKAKYEREQKKTSLLGEELKKCKTEALQRSTTLEDNMSFEGYAQQERSRSLQRSISSTSSTTDTPHQIPLGTLEVINRDKNGLLDSEHENLVKDHLTNRITQLTKQLQVTDSKSINFYQETHALYKQIILADKNKQKLTNELAESNKKIDNLQDELETTKRSYEEQLRMLSDHLCGMNEKLTSQKDEIDELKTSSATTPKLKFQLPGRKK